MHICIHICTYAHMHTYMYICAHAYILCMYVYYTVPSVPGNLTIRNVTSSSFDSSWTRPSYPNGVILSYQVTFTGIDTLNEVDDSFSDNSSINSTTEQLKVTGLVPFSSYAVYVVAFTSIGSGPLSDIVMIMTASSGTCVRMYSTVHGKGNGEPLSAKG